MRTRPIMPTITLLLMAAGCAMSPSGEFNANKDLVREFTDAANAADWDGLAEIVAEDFTRHSAATAGPPVHSRDEFIELQKIFLGSFPDQHVRLEQLIAEGDLVAALATYSGTQTEAPWGPFRPPVKGCKPPFWPCSAWSRARSPSSGWSGITSPCLHNSGCFHHRPRPPANKGRSRSCGLICRGESL